jgi:nucleoside-diphosphate-sugar epimerase
MRVLVTGHHGYVGTKIVPMLVEEGFNANGLDNDLYVEHKSEDAKSDILYLIKDIRGVEPSDLKGFDAVIHLAALSNDPLGFYNARARNKLYISSSTFLSFFSIFPE